MTSKVVRKSVLFVCIENASRSVMAEGYAKKLGLDATSAGTFPSTHVNSFVVDAMREVGIDVSKNRPKELNGSMINAAKLVVLTDASLEKAIPSKLRKKMKKAVEWYLPDPQGKSLDEIRGIRDQVAKMVEGLARGETESFVEG